VDLGCGVFDSGDKDAPKYKEFILPLILQSGFATCSRCKWSPSMSVTLGWEQPLIREASFASKPIVQLAGEPHGVMEWTAEEFLRHIK
jgi:hypothetical protein